MLQRDDGLTTTMLEELTGREIGIRLLGQRTARITKAGAVHPGAERVPRAGSRDADAACQATAELDLRPGDVILIRRVSLTDTHSTVYAVAEVIAALDRLPTAVTKLLFTTSTPFGKALAADGVAVTRELRRLGGYPAGRFAPMLGPTLDAASVVAGRTYRMVSSQTAAPLAVVTEWFAPRLFEQTNPGAASATARAGRRPHDDGPRMPSRAD